VNYNCVHLFEIRLIVNAGLLYEAVAAVMILGDLNMYCCVLVRSHNRTRVLQLMLAQLFYVSHLFYIFS